MTDGPNIESLSVLPDKLKTELSLHVNLDTLKQVIAIIYLNRPDDNFNLSTNIV